MHRLSEASEQPDAERVGGRRGGVVRDLDGADYAEKFLVAAVAAVLGIRAYLAATGYPQVGGDTLHIAHMLWGGLLMLVAVLGVLMFAGSGPRRAAAWIGGAGFGTFIDELGKFITTDNDYFYRPTAALIYVVFVVIFLGVRAVQRWPAPSLDERISYGMAALTDLRLGRLDAVRRGKALALLRGCDDPLASSLRHCLSGEVSDAQPDLLTRRWRWLRGALRRAASSRWAERITITVFLIEAAAVVASGAMTALGHSGSAPRLTVVTLGADLTVPAVGLLAVAGVVQLTRGRRQAALRIFYYATLVSLLFTQFFVFIEIQFAAFAIVAVNLALWAVLRSALQRHSTRL